VVILFFLFMQSDFKQSIKRATLVWGSSQRGVSSDPLFGALLLELFFRIKEKRKEKMRIIAILVVTRELNFSENILS